MEGIAIENVESVEPVQPDEELAQSLSKTTLSQCGSVRRRPEHKFAIQVYKIPKSSPKNSYRMRNVNNQSFLDTIANQAEYIFQALNRYVQIYAIWKESLSNKTILQYVCLQVNLYFD